MSRARLSFLLRGLLSVGLIALLLSRVHWGELAGLLREVHPAPLAGAGLLTLAGILLMSARVRLLLGHWGIPLNYRAALTLTWLGQFCNAFLPGSTGGDVIKFYRVCRIAPGAKTAGFAALVADRLAALVALVLLAAVALVIGDHGVVRQLASGVTLPGVGRVWIGGGAPALLALVLLTAVTVWLWRGGHFERTRGWWRPIRAQIRTGLRGGPFLGAALLLALTVHLSSITGFYLFARALQIPVSIGQIMLIWPMVMVATLLPLTVNGYGLRECVTLYYFQHWHLVSGLRPGAGVQETVIALSLLSVLNDFFWSLPGGFCLSAGSTTPPEGADLPATAGQKLC